LKKGVCLPHSSFVSTYTSASKFVCGVIVPGLANTCPLSISSLSIPLNSNQALSQACPWSNCLWNISTQVTVVFLVSLIPTNSTSSQTFTIHCSILPVATVPLPLIENTSSTDIRNGLSNSLFGTGTKASKASNNSNIVFAPYGFS
jgi:hypothetical protein